MMNRSTHNLNSGRRLLLAVAGFTAVALPLTVGAFHIPTVRAQQPGGPLEFDVASVKPANPKSTNGTVISVGHGGRLHVVNATIKDLIETAYDVRSFQDTGLLAKPPKGPILERNGGSAIRPTSLSTSDVKKTSQLML
jgi:hypothetical protein